MKWYLKVLKQYVDFEGRARRKEFWMFFLINLIISYTLQFTAVGMESPALTILSTVYSLAVFLPYIAVSIRRMHDIGKSGWYILIPIYNLILFATEGDKGQNEYGPDPKGDGSSEIDDIGKPLLED